MDPRLLGALFGIGAAFGWGASDFSGGAISRRGHVLGVILVSQVFGVLPLFGLAVLRSEPIPAPLSLAWAGVAGLIGTTGLAAFYRALATRRMGLVAPVRGVLSAAVPALAGSFLEGFPSPSQFVGFALAFVAVWLVSWSRDRVVTRLRDLVLPAIAGICFGLFLIIIDQVSQSAVLWPLVASRTASIAALAIVVFRMRATQTPTAGQLPVIAAAGVLEVTGNACYALAAQVGRMDVAAVLSSLGPAATVLLAWVLLKEALSRVQWLGVAAALAAAVLIAL